MLLLTNPFLSNVIKAKYYPNFPSGLTPPLDLDRFFGLLS
jgi:hypothetical protein